MVETTVVKTTTYNETALINALKQWWDDECGAANDPFATPPTMTVFDLTPSLDSLRVVKGLLVIEEIIGRKVPVKFIKRGGYDGFQEFIDDMLPKIRKMMVEQEPEAVPVGSRR